MAQYLKRLTGRSGWYFQRAVPKALQPKLGKKTWSWKAGHTQLEARRAVLGFLIRTDAEIVLATGTINDGLLKQIDSVPVYGFAEGLEAQGLMPGDRGHLPPT